MKTWDRQALCKIKHLFLPEISASLCQSWLPVDHIPHIPTFFSLGYLHISASARCAPPAALLLPCSSPGFAKCCQTTWGVFSSLDFSGDAALRIQHLPGGVAGMENPWPTGRGPGRAAGSETAGALCLVLRTELSTVPALDPEGNSPLRLPERPSDSQIHINILQFT